MSRMTPGLLWMAMICIDLATIYMNQDEAALGIAILIDPRTPTGISVINTLTLMKVEARADYMIKAGLAGMTATHIQAQCLGCGLIRIREEEVTLPTAAFLHSFRSLHLEALGGGERLLILAPSMEADPIR